MPIKPEMVRRPLSPVGIGLRDRHLDELVESEEVPSVGWVEILADNLFAVDEEYLKKLDALRDRFPFSLHSVGTSLGSTDPLDQEYMKRLKELVKRYRPFAVSEHLCWSSAHGVHLHDLFPLPMNDETVTHLVNRVDQVQDFLERQILIENVSVYTTFPESTMDEPTFITEIAKRSGSGILLDLNNIFINQENVGGDAQKYIASIPRDLVGEFHLAGGEQREGYILDSHSCPVWDEVWELYGIAASFFGEVPTLIEWDNEIPELSVLLGEALKAEAIVELRCAA